MVNFSQCLKRILISSKKKIVVSVEIRLWEDESLVNFMIALPFGL